LSGPSASGPRIAVEQALDQPRMCHTAHKVRELPQLSVDLPKNEMCCEELRATRHAEAISMV